MRIGHLWTASNRDSKLGIAQNKAELAPGLAITLSVKESNGV